MAFDHIFPAGATSKIIEVILRDSTTGGGKTGVAYTSVTASYVRAGGTRQAIVLAAGTAGDAYSSGKWAEVDATNQKGVYSLHIPDAALAVGVDAVTISLQASGVIDKAVRIVLLVANLYVANLAADLKAITAGVDLSATMKTSVTTAATAATPTAAAVTADVGITQAGADKVWSTTIRAITDKAGFALSSAGVQAIWDALTSALTTVGSIGKKLADWTIGTAQTGDAYARLGAPAGASLSADLAAVKSDSGAIKAKTDNLPASPAAVGSAMTLTAAYDAAKTAAQAGDAMALTTAERAAAAAALLDLAAGVETSWTVRQALRIMLAAIAGKADGAATTTMHFRDMADSKNRLTATVDADGNRTAVTRDAT